MQIKALLFAGATLGLICSCASPTNNQPTSDHLEASPAKALAWNGSEHPELAELVEDFNKEQGPDALVSANRDQVAFQDQPATPGVDLLESGKSLQIEGKLGPARHALTRALHSWSLDGTQTKQAIETLDTINRSLFTSSEDGGDMKTYTVARGDSLALIAKDHHTTWQFLRRINGLDRTTIYVGQKLKVPSQRFGLTIKRDAKVLDVTYNGIFIKRYAIAIGNGDSTPTGVFKVIDRKEHPQDNGHAFGSVEHAIGSHWLGLKGEEGYEGYGIHGLRPADAARLSSLATQGTIALANSDIEELHDLLSVGSIVTILA